MPKKRSTRSKQSRPINKSRKHRGGNRRGKCFCNSLGKVVGKIYSNGCGHCKTLEKPWDDLKRILKGGNVMFKDIEASNMDKELVGLNNEYLNGKQQQVSLQQGFPTIYKIDKGIVSYYDGEREIEPMKKFIQT